MSYSGYKVEFLVVSTIPAIKNPTDMTTTGCPISPISGLVSQESWESYRSLAVAESWMLMDRALMGCRLASAALSMLEIIKQTDYEDCQDYCEWRCLCRITLPDIAEAPVAYLHHYYGVDVDLLSLHSCMTLVPAQKQSTEGNINCQPNDPLRTCGHPLMVDRSVTVSVPCTVVPGRNVSSDRKVRLLAGIARY
ncbi:hypothetical protein J6590_001914 [Homalodisca vitripennis]|nr:hypothetical protein J6590_001914 [Homalodisca vitripennis]